MKLRSCHIDNFGKLSDLHLEFQDGVNLFHEPNAWGKSTLAAFLRVMFYGFDSKRESGLFDKERVVFRPWQGGTYGGELDFSYQGKEYRISRTFGKTEKTDVFHLYDLSTNLECHDFSSEIGSEIFGLDSASFKRSAFIAQNDCECCSTDAINAKLGNLVENTNDINNFETAQKKIHDRMNKLSPDRATGSMKKRTNMITLLTEELRGYDAAEASYKKITEKLTEKQEQRKELAGIRDQYAKALQVASEESRREGIKQAYAATKQEEQEKKAALDAFADVFPGQVPQDEEFARQNQDVQMLGVLKTTLFNLGLTEEEENRLQELGDKFENQIPSEEKITEMEKEQERFAKLKEEKTQLETKIEAMAMKREAPDYTVKNRLPMMICGIILLVIGAAGGVLSFLLPQVHKFFLPLLAVSVVAAVAGIVLLVVRKVQVSKEEERCVHSGYSIWKRSVSSADRWKKFKKPWKRLRKKLRASNRRPSIFWSSIRWFREKRMPEPACMNSAASCRNMSVCAAVPEKAMRQDRNLSGNRTLCLHLEKKREWISEKILQQESASYR